MILFCCLLSFLVYPIFDIHFLTKWFYKNRYPASYEIIIASILFALQKLTFLISGYRLGGGCCSLFFLVSGDAEVGRVEALSCEGPRPGEMRRDE